MTRRGIAKFLAAAALAAGFGASGEEARVVFLGGETVARFGAGGPGAGAKVFRRTFAGAPYWAVGVAGTNLTAGLKPEAVVVCAGEDMLDGPAADAIAHVTGIVRRAREGGARVVLCAMPPRGKTRDDPLRRKVALVNTQLRNFADGRNVLWADCGGRLLFPDGAYVPELQADGARLTQYGYEIFAASVLPAVNHILRGEPYVYAAEYPASADPNAYAREGTWSKLRLGRCGEGLYGGSWSGRPEAIRRKIREKKGGTFDVVFCGDSITHQWETVGKRVYAELCAKYDILNLGYSGDQTGHLLWRLENGELEGYRARLFMVAIGTNNPGSPRERAEGVREVVRVIRERHPEAKVLLLPIFPCGERAEDKGRVRNAKTNPLIAELADGEDVIWVDVWGKFIGEGGVISREVLYDFLHPAEGGYRIWAEAVEPYFRRYAR